MNTTARAGLAIVVAAAPLFFAGCASASKSRTAEPVTGEQEVVGFVETRTAGSGACAAARTFGDEEGLFGREWLLAYRGEPAASVSLFRCHYVHRPNGEVDLSTRDGTADLMAGDLASEQSVVTDDNEVRSILVALPDATDPSLWRCPGGQPVADFDQFTVLDRSGTAVAQFQSSAGGNGCGMFRVLPST